MSPTTLPARIPSCVPAGLKPVSSARPPRVAPSNRSWSARPELAVRDLAFHPCAQKHYKNSTHRAPWTHPLASCSHYSPLSVHSSPPRGEPLRRTMSKHPAHSTQASAAAVAPHPQSRRPRPVFRRERRPRPTVILSTQATHGGRAGTCPSPPGTWNTCGSTRRIPPVRDPQTQATPQPPPNSEARKLSFAATTPCDSFSHTTTSGI